MLLNPAYGRLGMIDLPQLLLTLIVVPWFELLSLIALPLAPLAGVLTVRAADGQRAGDCVWQRAADRHRDAAVANGVWTRSGALVLGPLAPLEVFLARPARLWSRVKALTGALVRTTPLRA